MSIFFHKGNTQPQYFLFREMCSHALYKDGNEQIKETKRNEERNKQKKKNANREEYWLKPVPHNGKSVLLCFCRSLYRL